MHRSTVRSNPPVAAAPRRLILGVAFVLALTVWLAPKVPSASAQEPKPPAAAAAPAVPSAPAVPATPADSARPAAGGDPRSVEINIGIKADPETAKAISGTEGAAATARAAAGSGERTVTIRKGGKTVTVTGIPGDREFDSVEQFVHTEPALASMVVAIVAVVFFAPVLAIALILGYRMRKARMQNETMLRLAEKGIVPPTGTFDTVAGSKPAAAIAAASIYQPAKELRKRAAWSDLRKGVIMGAIGLALTLYSMLEDRTPNGIGLVLLFVGIGYVALWWFEQRQVAPPDDRAGAAPGTGPGGPA